MGNGINQQLQEHAHDHVQDHAQDHAQDHVQDHAQDHVQDQDQGDAKSYVVMLEETADSNQLLLLLKMDVK
jgi:hypothetical protein